MPVIPAAIALIFIGYLFSSVKIIARAMRHWVERLGRFHRKLTPGLHVIFPPIDRIVFQETIREKVLDVPPQQCITSDNVSLMADAVVYWRITDMIKARYAVEDVQRALVNLVLTALRAEIGRMDLDQTFSSRAEINARLLAELDEATDPWGIKITRVEVRDIQPSKTVQDSMEKQMAAEREKRAAILRSEGEQQASINQAAGAAKAQLLRAEAEKRQRLLLAEGTAEAIKTIAAALQEHPEAANALQYLMAQSYIDMGLKVGSSPSSKVIFMDPRSIPATLQGLVSMVDISKVSQGSSSQASEAPQLRTSAAFSSDLEIPPLNS
jgi:regulator of protease activity HflC (stomatin/prohibitin superfamily)